MKKIFGKLWSKFLTIFGDIKLFKWPMFIIYDPVLYQIKGSDLRRIINTLQVGDIVCRNYRHYADGFLIPGKYSHSGVYVGDGMIIHAVAEGVSKIDVLDFFQADGGAILRLKGSDTEEGKKKIKEAVDTAYSKIGTKYDFYYSESDDALYCHELTATCFKFCEIRRHIATALWVIIRKKEPVYLAESFIESPDFEVILEV